MIDFAKRHVLVIGGTGTIGSAAASMALVRGAQVTATGRSIEEDDRGRAWIGWRRLDVTDRDAVDRLLHDLGDVTDIVLTAAARPFDDLVDIESDDLTALVDTRLWGAFHVGRVAADGLDEDGTVTFLSGTLATYPETASPVAAVSAAVETLGRGLAVELAPIRVNVVSPAALGTSGRGHHQGRADDVAQAILSSIENPWISGSVIALHGAGHP